MWYLNGGGGGGGGGGGCEVRDVRDRCETTHCKEGEGTRANTLVPLSICDDANSFQNGLLLLLRSQSLSQSDPPWQVVTIDMTVAMHGG